MLIVTETNTNQRSMSDLPHSERAVVIAVRHKAMKGQGVRTDLLNEIEMLSKSPNLNDDVTSDPMGQKLDTRDKVGLEYGMGTTSVARYLRVNELPDDFKEWIDNGNMSLRAGVDLSYLKEDSLNIVHAIITEDNYKIDMKRAQALKIADKKEPLTFETANLIIKGEPKKEKEEKPKAPKYWTGMYSKFFAPKLEEEEVRSIIEQALEMYYDSQNQDEIVSEEDEEEMEP